ncbi:unnamed protein product, partial [Prorocentrum cordatum]
ALALRGVRTAAVDLRGHGLSPLGRPEDFGPAQLAADVRAALRKAGVTSGTCPPTGGKRIVLVGHSMGGKIALRYAADYPDDVGALVIEDMDCTSRRYPADYLQPSAAEMERKRSFDRAFADWEACRASLVSFGYGEARVDGWLKETPPRVLAQADAGLGRSGLWSAINPYAQWLARTTVLTQADAYEALHRIAAVRACDRPDLQVHVLVAGAAGTVCDWQDEPGSIRDMEGVLPGLRVTEFPSAGHSIHNSDQAPAMARSSFGALLLAAASAWLLAATLSPAFAGTGALPSRAARGDRVARQAGSEIMLTAPSIGGRYRVIIDESTTVESCLAKARKIFEIDQDFLPDSDFNVYLKEDESKPISGKIADHTELRPWGPDGIELHIYYEPK